MSRRSFTLVELLVVIVMISIGLIAVLEGISYALRMLTKTKSDVVAINLAREGMEAVYTIRNTNRLRWSGEKDANWLNIDPMLTGSAWMQSGVNYVVTLTGGVWKMTLPSIIDNTLTDNTFSTTNNNFRLCTKDGKYVPCISQGGDPSPYFRVITGKGLYNKESGMSIECADGSTSVCDNDTAKEFRFCSRVVSESGMGSDVEYCGVLTNFKK